MVPQVVSRVANCEDGNRWCPFGSLNLVGGFAPIDGQRRLLRPQGIPEGRPYGRRLSTSYTAAMKPDYDVLIIGSGFGGSASALRLTEKGYRVGVLEAGRRFSDEEFAKTSWNLRKFLWAPSSAATASSGSTCCET